MAASGRQHSLVTGSHLQPLAATRVAASGRKWPPDILPRKLFHIFRGKPTLGTTGKDPQRKRTSLNEKEGEAIMRKLRLIKRGGQRCNEK